MIRVFIYINCSDYIERVLGTDVRREMCITCAPDEVSSSDDGVEVYDLCERLVMNIHVWFNMPVSGSGSSPTTENHETRADGYRAP